MTGPQLRSEKTFLEMRDLEETSGGSPIESMGQGQDHVQKALLSIVVKLFGTPQFHRLK